jgi:hypothetical protein
MFSTFVLASRISGHSIPIDVHRRSGIRATHRRPASGVPTEFSPRAVPCARNAADTITLNDGSGEMFGLLTAFPTCHFDLFGGKDGVVTGNFGDYPYVPGLQQCMPCDPLSGSQTILLDFGMGTDAFGRRSLVLSNSRAYPLFQAWTSMTC